MITTTKVTRSLPGYLWETTKDNNIKQIRNDYYDDNKKLCALGVILSHYASLVTKMKNTY